MSGAVQRSCGGDRSRAGQNLYDRHGEPADADQFFAFVVDADLPHMRSLTDVQWPGGACDKTVSDAADMVGIDLETHAIVLFLVDHEGGSHASHRLGECDRSAAVEKPIGLAGTMIHRHAGLQEIVSDPGEFDSDVFTHGLVTEGAQLFGRDGGIEPDGHQRTSFCSFNEVATTSGRNCSAFPPLRNTSRTRVEATEVYCGRQVRKMVSISWS